MSHTSFRGRVTGFHSSEGTRPDVCPGRETPKPEHVRPASIHIVQGWKRLNPNLMSEFSHGVNTPWPPPV
jgi:hypothetical protein